MPIKGSYLAIAGAGGVLLWSGLRGKQWSDVLRQTIAGKPPATTTTAYPLITNVNSSPSDSGTTSNITSGGGTPAQNAALAKRMCAQAGWTGVQWLAFAWIAVAESGWRTNARNPSGAYGIPQALPGNKMASAGSDWQTNPATQIRWMIGYIRSTYGDPVRAKMFHLIHGWY